MLFLLQAKEESLQAAEAARAAAVAPLQAEVARLTERVQGLQQLHASELAALEAAARQQAAAAHSEAQAVVDRLTASGASLQQQLRGEGQRAEGLAADLARMQVCKVGGIGTVEASNSRHALWLRLCRPLDVCFSCAVRDELAKHTQRAATKIELQGKEVEMLKGRIRWGSSGMERWAPAQSSKHLLCCLICLHSLFQHFPTRALLSEQQGDGGPGCFEPARAAPAAPARAGVDSGTGSLGRQQGAGLVPSLARCHVKTKWFGGIWPASS